MSPAVLHARRARRLLVLLAAVLAVGLATLAVLGVQAAPAPGAQNATRVFNPAIQALTGGPTTGLPSSRPDPSGPATGIAAGCCVATEGADVLATPAVESSKLQNIVNDLYKGTTNPGRVGNGTTADAVRAEAETGQPTGGVFHTTKAEQYSTALTKLLQRGDLNPHDQLVARSLYDDLQSALGNGP